MLRPPAAKQAAVDVAAVGAKMLLFVKKLTGKKVPVEVQPEDTVDDLMCAVMCGGARLQFKGQPVEPSTPIAQIAGLKVSAYN